MHDPEIKASVTAALLAGQGISETARRYGVPKATVASWRDETRTAVSVKIERSETQSWLPPDADEGDFWMHLDQLGKEYIVGLRTVVRYLTDPHVLSNVAFAHEGYSAVVAAHESLGTRVAGLLQAGGAIQQRQPAPTLDGPREPATEVA